MSQECSYDVNDYKWTAECDGTVATITDIFDYKFEVIKFNNCKIEEKCGTASTGCPISCHSVL